MGTESIEASFLSIFALISFFIFFITSKYSHKIKNGALLDIDFVKPQSFHDLPGSRSGGIPILFSLSIFFVIYYLLYSKILYDYILISYSMFLIGFLDDIKISIKPIKRLISYMGMLHSDASFFGINLKNKRDLFMEYINNPKLQSLYKDVKEKYERVFENVMCLTTEHFFLDQNKQKQLTEFLEVPVINVVPSPQNVRNYKV